jgi:hypothetical protein
MIKMLTEQCQRKYSIVYSQEGINSLRCKELRLGGTRTWVMYTDMKVDIKRIVICKNKLNFYKTGLSRKKQKMEKEEVEGETNLRNRKMLGIDVICAYYKCKKMSNSC